MDFIARLSPEDAIAIADGLLTFHFAVVMFNVLMPPLIVLGAWRGWAVVRQPVLRLTHLIAIAVVAVQGWFGEHCFLTVWESDLREHAGQAGYTASFIETWLAAWLYVDAPFVVFVAVYTLWMVLSLALWFLVPPRPLFTRGRAPGPG